MSRVSVQVTYHKGRPLAAYIGLECRPGEKSARVEMMAPGIVVDFMSDGRPMGIEVVTPEATPVEEILEVFDRLDLERPNPGDLAPLGHM